MFVRKISGNPAFGRPVDKAIFHQIWLIYVLNGPGVLPQRSGKGVKPYRPPLEFLNHSHNDIPVILVQPIFVYFQQIQRKNSYFHGDFPIILYLRKIPHPL